MPEPKHEPTRARITASQSENRSGAGTSSRARRAKLAWLLPAACGALLLTFRLADVAGLHRDEAAFALFAEEIREGLRPLRGYFNTYTSPVHSYVIAGFFSVLGESIWALRISGVLANLMATALYADLVRRLSADRSAGAHPVTSDSVALWSLWFLVTLPAFVVMTRIAGENYALSPLLLFGGMWAFYVLGEHGRARATRVAGHVLAGLSFCWCIWNHVVSLPTIAALVVTYLVFVRPDRGRVAVVLPRLLAGGLIGATPKLYGVLFLDHDFAPASQTAASPFSDAVLNLLYTLGGDALYARACGFVSVSFNRVLPVALAASITVLFRHRLSPGFSRLWTASAVCFAFSFVGSWAITPSDLLGSRIWLLPLWFVPVMLALALPSRPRALRLGLGSALVILNLAGIGLNYFHAFLRTGGTAKTSVYVGGREDNSLDFIDVRPLIAKIVPNSDGPLFIEDVTTHRIRFLVDRPQRKRVFTLGHLDGAETAPQGSVVALYRTPGREMPPTIRIGQVMAWKREELAVPQYQVYEVTGDE